MPQVAHWTYSEYDCVYRKYHLLGAEGCSKKINRPTGTINNKARLLGVSPFRIFTEHELKMAESYGGKLGQALMFLLPDRTSTEVSELLKSVGL